MTRAKLAFLIAILTAIAVVLVAPHLEMADAQKEAAPKGGLIQQNPLQDTKPMSIPGQREADPSVKPRPTVEWQGTEESPFKVLEYCLDLGNKEKDQSRKNNYLKNAIEYYRTAVKEFEWLEIRLGTLEGEKKSAEDRHKRDVEAKGGDIERLSNEKKRLEEELTAEKEKLQAVNKTLATLPSVDQMKTAFDKLNDMPSGKQVRELLQNLQTLAQPQTTTGAPEPESGKKKDQQPDGSGAQILTEVGTIKWSVWLNIALALGLAAAIAWASFAGSSRYKGFMGPIDKQGSPSKGVSNGSVHGTRGATQTTEPANPDGALVQGKQEYKELRESIDTLVNRLNASPSPVVSDRDVKEIRDTCDEILSALKSSETKGTLETLSSSLTELSNRFPKPDPTQQLGRVQEYYKQLAEVTTQNLDKPASGQQDERATTALRRIGDLLGTLSNKCPEDLNIVIGRMKGEIDSCLDATASTERLKATVATFRPATEPSSVENMMLKEEAHTLTDPKGFQDFQVDRLRVAAPDDAVARWNETQLRRLVFESVRNLHVGAAQTAGNLLHSLQSTQIFDVLGHVESRVRLHDPNNGEIAQLTTEILRELGLKEMEVQVRTDTFNARLHDRQSIILTRDYGPNTIMEVVNIGVTTRDGSQVLRKARVVVAGLPGQR